MKARDITPSSLHVHLVEPGPEPASQGDGVAGPPEMHEEEVRALLQHMAVESGDLDAVRPERTQHRGDLSSDHHEVSGDGRVPSADRKSTRLNSSHPSISY